MKSSKMKISTLLAIGAVGLAACGSDRNFTPPPVPDPGPPPVQTESFTMFVKDQFADTADNTDPVEINDVEFDFDNSDNPSAYDDLLDGN